MTASGESGGRSSAARARVSADPERVSATG
jgi:hypothetical protein